MNLNILKLAASILLITLCNVVSAQVAGTNNTLGTTGITAIQSGTATGYKLSIGGASKIFGTGAAGVVGSPTLLIGNNTSTTGKKYGIYASDAGQFQIYDSTGVTPTIRFNIAPTTGNIGIGTLTTAAANKLEIDNTTANTSGLRFTRLTSASTVTPVNGKKLSVNTTGDVILTDDNSGIVQAPNTLLAGPASGATSVIPTFRSLVALDIPNLDMTKITTGNLPLTRIGNVTPARLLGRFNVATGTVEEISLGSGLTLNSSGVLSAAGGGSMVYPAAGIAVSTGTAWGTSITDNSANWTTAFTDRLKWDGGATGLVAATGRTSLGATTIGSSLFTTTNPSAISFLRANADNTVSFLDAATFRTAIGAEGGLTFGTGLTRTANNVTVNNSQNITILSNLTTNGYVKTSASNGTLGVVTTIPQAEVTNLTTDLATKLSNITGLVNAGTNVTVTGSGTSASPYVINSSAGGASQWTTSGANIYNSNTGNVGIGITSPIARLHLLSSGGLNSGILVQSSSSSSYATTDWKNDLGELTQMVMAGSTFSNGIFNPSSATFNTDASGGMNLASYHSNGVIRFATGGALASNERMRINSIGNVGIGTTTPTYKLDVTGNLRTSADANINGITIGKGTNNIATNTAIGFNTLNNNTTADINTAVGYAAGSNITTGGHNAFFGGNAGLGLTTGVENTGIGYATMTNTVGNASTALGAFALQNWISGNYNVAIGYDAMHGSGTGTGNIGIGRNVMLGAVTGNWNVGLGHSAINSITSGSNNIGIGQNVANNLTTGSNNIHIGTALVASSPSVSNELNIGNWIYGASGNIGIAKASPTEKLDVNGNIYTNGKILINQANTAAVAPYALAVNGTAIFTKAVVKLNANWPDYVFEPNYNLPSLIEVEQYIQKNKHLPNVPNAEQIKKEGIDLGNSQTIQMQKIEELTLYIIELNKKLDALQKDNTEIKKQLNKIAQKN